MEREREVLEGMAAVMAAGPGIAEAVPGALRLLAQALSMRRAVLALRDDEAGEVAIDVADGLTDEQIRLGHYRLGEGVTGHVAETGVAAVVPSTASCPDFLNRTGAGGVGGGGDSCFICVPVRLGSDVIGTIWVDGECRDAGRLDDDARLLGLAAALLAQAIRLRRAARERHETLLDENRRLRGELRDAAGRSNLVGRSREMRIVFDQIRQVADSPSTVLIRGETGTGKELVARALHYNGARASGPFVRVNCAALPETLIESELFGHEKGAFTGAVAARAGRFEQADGGTIFLDEIGDISPLMQVKLLRVLQEREFERVGGNRTVKIDVRVVAATHRDLAAMVRDGSFRGDLYYRINVFPINLLPLRSRLSDLPLLADHFLRKYAGRSGKAIAAFSPDVLDIFARHAWPGNVRELENCVEHAVILCPGGDILPSHLPAGVLAGPDEPSAGAPASSLDYKTRVDEFERGLLSEALRATRGNITKAAERLSATPRVIAYRIRQLGIDVGRFF